jgi:hypothetical protein
LRASISGGTKPARIENAVGRAQLVGYEPVVVELERTASPGQVVECPGGERLLDARLRQRVKQR